MSRAECRNPLPREGFVGNVAAMTDSLQPASRYQIAAWLMMAAGLLLSLVLRLLPALLAGLLVVQLVSLLAPRFVIGRLEPRLVEACWWCRSSRWSCWARWAD
jgi:hypothetical protein